MMALQSASLELDPGQVNASEEDHDEEYEDLKGRGHLLAHSVDLLDWGSEVASTAITVSTAIAVRPCQECGVCRKLHLSRSARPASGIALSRSRSVLYSLENFVWTMSIWFQGLIDCIK